MLQRQKYTILFLYLFLLLKTLYSKFYLILTLQISYKCIKTVKSNNLTTYRSMCVSLQRATLLSYIPTFQPLCTIVPISRHIFRILIDCIKNCFYPIKLRMITMIRALPVFGIHTNLFGSYQMTWRSIYLKFETEYDKELRFERLQLGTP